ncbi:hypothetical protein [Phocaeicola coprophilus]
MNAKDCCDILTQAGIRPTSTRILVYEAIAEEKNTFSLGDLEERLPSIDKSGLFRTLTLLPRSPAHSQRRRRKRLAEILFLSQSRKLPQRRRTLPFLL